MRPLAKALSDERRRGEAVHGGVVAEVLDLSDDRLAQAESDLFDYLTTGPARYPQANWKLTAVVYATVVEERAFREFALNHGL